EEDLFNRIEKAGLEKFYVQQKHPLVFDFFASLKHEESVEVRETVKQSIDYIYNVAIKRDRKSTRLNSSHVSRSYAVFCLKKQTGAPGGEQTHGLLGLRAGLGRVDAGGQPVFGFHVHTLGGQSPLADQRTAARPSARTAKA